jgi:hypothetical protein
MLDFVLGEVIRPIAFGIGWALLYAISFGRIRKATATKRTTAFAGLIGIYGLCFIPAAAVVAYHQMAG